MLLFPLSKTEKVRKAGDLLRHPGELLLLLKYKFIYAKKMSLPDNLSEASRYCYEKLPQVSRSFAAVILELPEELREPVSKSSAKYRVNRNHSSLNRSQTFIWCCVPWIQLKMT